MWSSFVRCGRPCGVPSFVAAIRVEFLRPWRPSVWSSFVRGGHPCGVPSFVVAVRVEFLRPWWPSIWSSFVRGGRPSDSFSSLWAGFTRTVHINALYNESVHGKEEHAT